MLERRSNHRLHTNRSYSVRYRLFILSHIIQTPRSHDFDIRSEVQIVRRARIFAFFQQRKYRIVGRIQGLRPLSSGRLVYISNRYLGFFRR